MTTAGNSIEGVIHVGYPTAGALCYSYARIGLRSYGALERMIMWEGLNRQY